MQIDYLLKEKEMILSRYLPSCMENIDILRLSEIPESAEKEMSMNERHILQSNIDELNAEIYICNKKINSKNEIIEKLTNNKRLMVALKGREY